MVLADEPSREARGLPDRMEGDIMAFSEADFARLGLAAEPDHPFDIRQQTQTNSWQSLQQLQHPVTVEGHSVTDPGLVNGQFLNMPASPVTRHGLLSHELGSTVSEKQTGRRLDNMALNPFLPGLPRRRSRYFSRLTRTASSEPLDIPSSSKANETSLDQMQRLRSSYPGVAAESIYDFVSTLDNTPLRTRSSAGSLYGQRVRSRAHSTTSVGSGTSCSSISGASANSVALENSSRGPRRRVSHCTRAPRPKGKDKESRIFSCTFCCDSFKSKYDWARHEKSLHLNLERWRCTPFGGTIVSPDTGRSHCAYCSQLDPTPDHLDSHNHGSCQTGQRRHDFSRKDHLVQHLKLVHHVQTLPIIDSWKMEGPQITSRCGFCDNSLQTWQERVDHLAKHFRKGTTMDNWKGEHCFEPSIAAQAYHAMPPYLIAAESRAPVPFSATSHGTKDHLSQIQRMTEQSSNMWNGSFASEPGEAPYGPQSLAPESQTLEPADKSPNLMTFPEVLALHLGRYAREQMQLGVVPSDTMFQEEARKIIFESQDPWDQTIADNNDWLSNFRNHHLGADSSSQRHSARGDLDAAGA